MSGSAVAPVAPDEPVSPVVCPLCGGGNACAMAAGAGDAASAAPCWCVAASFSDELLARLPTAARGRACICAACASAAKATPAPAADDAAR